MDKEDTSELLMPKRLSAARLSIFERADTVHPIQRKTQVPVKVTETQKIKERRLPNNQLFHSPMVLVSTVNGKTKCEESTLAKLHEIEQALNIVSVVGTLRTGKSFLLNKLARHSSADANSWFETGHTTNAVTKGIWILCRPHPTQEDQVLVLLDTEGIDDPDKVDIEDDKNLFLLATLLSSTMVYNTMGNFDRNAINKFTFLSRIKTSVKVNGSEEDDSILDFFFPNFVLTLRDVTLDTNSKDDDTFLENTLMLKCENKGSNATKELKEFNLPRILIRRYFKKRKCFRFKKPVKTEQLKELMTIPESGLKKGFQKTLNEFRDFVLSCEPKVLKSGRALNGRMFSTLLLNYVTSIQMNEPPCLISAMKLMAAAENTYIVSKATDVYNAEMKKRIGSYTPSDVGLVNYHKDSMKAALEVLKVGLIIDDEQIYEEQAMACFKSHFEKIKTRVKEELKEKCWKILDKLNAINIQAKIRTRQYCTMTGYDDYLKDLDSVTQQFNRQTGYMGFVTGDTLAVNWFENFKKGVLTTHRQQADIHMARTVLQVFLDGKSDEEEMVYKMVMEASDRHKREELKRRNIKRATIYREEDEMILKQEEDAEESIRADIESIQVNGLQNISRQYLDILKTKIEEVDRLKQELTHRNSYYVQLCKETKHWKEIFDKTTWNMPQTGDRESQEEVIGLLWKKVMDEDMSDDPVYCNHGIHGRKKGQCDIL